MDSNDDSDGLCDCGESDNVPYGRRFRKDVCGLFSRRSDRQGGAVSPRFSSGVDIPWHALHPEVFNSGTGIYKAFDGFGGIRDGG